MYNWMILQISSHPFSYKSDTKVNDLQYKQEILFYDREAFEGCTGIELS